MEEHQNKLAPCAKALFIGPSARSASCDARPPARDTSQTKQRLDGKARVELSCQIPDLTDAIRAMFSDHQDQQYPKTASLLARAPLSGNTALSADNRMQT
jgi:hypothetical protein